MQDTLIRYEPEKNIVDSIIGDRFTPAEVLDLYEFTPYLVPILPAGRPLKGGKLSEGKEPNWNVIKRQRGTKSQNIYRETQPSLDEVLEWLEFDPETNMGVLAGEVQGKVVLDVDGPFPSCWTLLDMPDTPTSATGRIEGGCHIYYGTSGHVHTTDEVTLPCKREYKTKFKIMAEGNYVVAPGSLHKSGKRYAWVPGLTPMQVELAPLPDGLLEVFDAAGDKSTPPTLSPVKSHKKLTHTSIGAKSDKVSIHLVRDKGSVLDSELVGVLNQSLEAGVMILEELGCPAREHGAFSCIRHPPDETPSAALHQEDDGNVMYKCFHHDKKEVAIGQVYAECMNGTLYDAPRNDSTVWSEKRMDKGEAKAWTVRAYHDLLGYELPDLKVKPRELEFTAVLGERSRALRADARANIEKVYRGFILLLRVREAYEPGSLPAPYSYRFAARWCGMKREAAGAAVKWLFAHGYLTSNSKTCSGLNLISLKGVRESTSTIPEVKIDEIEAQDIASAVTEVGQAITDLRDKFKILAEELELDETALMKAYDAVVGG